ncbi:MAG TPA: hypothetical protein V6D28_09605 [Leptolyngbyaceae cyanobacterium]
MSLNINFVNLLTVVKSALETIQLAADAKKIEIQPRRTRELAVG